MNIAGTIRRGMTVMAMVALCGVIAVPAYAAYEDSLKGYWKFDETTPATAIDSAAGYDGANNGATINVSGKYGKAYSFDGSNDYIDCGDPVDGSFDSFSALTISAWVRLNSLGTFRNFFTKEDGNSDKRQYYFQFDTNNKLAARVSGQATYGDVVIATSTLAYTDTTDWHYVVMTYSGSEGLNLYYDAILAGSNPATLNASATAGNDVTLKIGTSASLGGPAGFFKGSIDDVAIWSRPLDANEVTMLYDLGTEKFEWLTLGVNDSDKLNLGYTTSELKLLADLYSEGNAGISENIDGVTWRYLSGDLPGDIGGTTYDYGDTWTYEGRSYIKLGSGLEGSPVPEPGCAFGLLVGFFVPGVGRVFKRMRHKTR